ncbi:BadF/BadG/BcrA/BcrD ATPase family protein [Aliiroseovarius marinus]|uniref:BadF/BadG/BcrA/BcrD ATPase family protein n=1 Tax=Aliiroseovarius marinus TaxID=2500159 RepID=UPI001061D570|nr:BadF/BadG/BcrA/BcrD ATPase family protein [Aliiroseovarius marinus]
MNDLPSQHSAPVIAIDGGGTRCRLALTSNGAPVVVEVGSVNVTSDFDAAIDQLSRGVHKLATQAGRRVEDLATVPTYAGLAGVMDTAMGRKVAAALPQKHIRVEDDRHAALRGALGATDGVMAHCGTGSFIAAQVAGKSRFVGGWGAVLGDPASAQWVGRRALTLTLDVVDGLRAPSALSEHMLKAFTNSAGIVAFAAQARPADFGALAPAVTQLASDKDSMATQILTEAAQSIADLLPQLGWTPGMALCLTGGIGPLYAPYLPGDIAAHISAPLGAPLSGAIALAQSYRDALENGAG